MRFLLDSSFHVYRAFQCPTFSEIHKREILAHVANYIYIKYTSTTSDLIPKYKSSDDVTVKANSGRIMEDDLTVSYLTLDHSSTQIIAFLQKNDKVVVLVKSQMPVFLVQMLESLDFETPLILQAHPITPNDIYDLVNGLADLAFGNVDLTFVPQEKLTNDSLKEIIVNIPLKDSSRIVDSAPMDAMVLWLTKTTNLNFANLRIKSLESNIVGISANGRIKITGELLDEEMLSILSTICAKF